MCLMGAPLQVIRSPMGLWLRLSVLAFIWLFCSIWSSAKNYNSILFVSTPSSNDSSTHLFTQQVALECQAVDKVKSDEDQEGAVG